MNLCNVRSELKDTPLLVFEESRMVQVWQCFLCIVFAILPVYSFASLVCTGPHLLHVVRQCVGQVLHQRDVGPQSGQEVRGQEGIQATIHLLQGAYWSRGVERHLAVALHIRKDACKHINMWVTGKIRGRCRNKQYTHKISSRYETLTTKEAQDSLKTCIATAIW